MAIFVLSYDLKAPGRDYKPLVDELKRLDAHRTLDSFWLINVDNTARDLLEHFKSFLDESDALWVLELTKAHTFTNAKAGTNDWIRDNPPA